MAADDDLGGRGARQRYLDAGVELLRIQGPGIVASDIRIADVAERVGVSPAAVYKLWSEQGGQEQFRHDLARHAYRTIPRNQITGEVARAAELAIDLDSSFAELVRVCADTDLRSLTSTPDSMAVLYALYSAAYHDQSLVEDAGRASSPTSISSSRCTRRCSNTSACESAPVGRRTTSAWRSRPWPTGSSCATSSIPTGHFDPSN